MQTRKVTAAVLAISWFVVIAGIVFAGMVSESKGAETAWTADIFVSDKSPNEDAGIFNKDRRQKRKPKDKEEPRVTPYDPETAPEFDKPILDSDESDPKKRKGFFRNLFSKINLENIVEVVVPLLAVFGGFKMGTSDTSIKMLLTTLSALKKEKFNEILKDVPRSDAKNPVPEPDTAGE